MPRLLSAAEWLLALRYLRARRQEGFLSIIAGFSLVGIALGVATLIIVMSVMNGFRIELLDRILGLNGQLAVIGGAQSIESYDALAGRLRALPGVASVTPVTEGQGIAARGGKTQGVLIRGVRPEDLRQHAFIAGNISAGSLDGFGDRAIVVGERLRQQLGIEIGQNVTLISSQMVATPIGLLPRTAAFRVVASFDIGMYEYDSRFVFMPLEAAQAFFDLHDRATMMEIRVAPGAALGVIESEAVGIAARAGSVINWERSNEGFFSVVRTQASVLFLILTLIVLVAAFNIVSSLVILVRTKTGEIAILRTIGASRGTIMRVFVLSGAFIGGAGTLLGVVLGVLIGGNVEGVRRWLQDLLGVELFPGKLYFLTRLPSVIDTGDVVLITLMALTLSLLATLYPSWRAASLDPVEGLRDG